MRGRISVRIARAISQAANPFFLPIPVWLVAAYEGSETQAQLLFWIALSLLLFILFPIAYAYARVLFEKVRTKATIGFRSFFRARRGEVFIMNAIVGVPTLLILLFLGAPSAILATFVALNATSVVVGLVNTVYRASFHIASMTALVAVFSILLGKFALASIILLLTVGWARYWLKEHSPGQLATGFALASLATVITFYAFGLLSNFS